MSLDKKKKFGFVKKVYIDWNFEKVLKKGRLSKNFKIFSIEIRFKETCNNGSFNVSRARSPKIGKGRTDHILCRKNLMLMADNLVRS